MQIFHLVLAVGMLVSGVSCTMVGTGTRTVIKAQTDKGFILARYPHLLAHPYHGDDKNIVFFGKDGIPGFSRRPRQIGKYGMLGLSRSPQALHSAFRGYMKAKYGNSDFKAARLTFSVRDRDKTPAFLPTDAVALAAKNGAEIVTADSKLTTKQRIRYQELLEARLLNVPDLPRTTTLHHTDEEGRDIYYYYPRIEIDFSAEILSATNLDRFSFLGLVIVLKSGGSEKCNCSTLGRVRNASRPRFINFVPKAADFAEFTRGRFTQNSQIQARAAYGSTRGSTITTTSPDRETTPNIVATLARNLSLGVEGSYIYSEGVVRELKDAIQRRATGLDKQGQIFFAEYRSINATRIGGTYNFDLMLEVPACGNDIEDTPYYESDPVVQEIKADIYPVGVVRHVHDRGKTGLILRYPETENDHVYEQVIVKDYENIPIWEFNGVPWIGKNSTFTLTVVSNYEGAHFVVKRISEDSTCQTSSKVIGDGSGSKTEVTLPIAKGLYRACVEFLPVVDTNAKPNTVVLKVTESPETFTVPQDGGDQTIIGTYRLPPRQEGDSGE